MPVDTCLPPAQARFNSSGMKTHLKSCHKPENEAAEEADKVTRAGKMLAEEEAVRKDETERGVKQIFSLKTKKQRSDFLKQVSTPVI